MNFDMLGQQCAFRDFRDFSSSQLQLPWAFSCHDMAENFKRNLLAQIIVVASIQLFIVKVELEQERAAGTHVVS